MKFNSVLIAALVWLAAVPVLAAPAERPCRADIQKHCSDKVGDQQAMGQCVRENFANLSEQCQTALMARRGQGGADGQRQPQAESEETPAKAQ